MTEMIFRNLSASGDWTRGSGIGNYVSGNQAIGLDIKTSLLSWLNDCFFNKLAGIDWKNRLGSKNQRILLQADLRRVILSRWGVVGINSVSTSLVVRDFTANYDIDTIYSKNYKQSVALKV